MGRSPTYSVDGMLVAAAKLFASDGIRAVTMTAVASELGAPSGSIYHRFPDRASLLAALWLRTAHDFEAGFLEVLGEKVTTESAIDAAVWCVDWCRANPAQAAVLQAGHRAFGSDAWPPADRELLTAADALRDKQIQSAVRTVAKSSGRPGDEVAFAMFELPIAVVRSYLNEGKPVPARAADRVRRLATRLLRD
ncbi:TetR/AcrR family transcriptional regulator [Flexivirga alba]|uniref:TetR/AcrR family transcriptional regulator n=1 Tax=Flexivirga alba TaxID=702742 RepID=A0ABW2AHC8_9MICO